MYQPPKVPEHWRRRARKEFDRTIIAYAIFYAVVLALILSIHPEAQP